jgi:hypothetical protein
MLSGPQPPATQNPEPSPVLYENVCEKPASALIFALRAAFMLSGNQPPAPSPQHRLYENVCEKPASAFIFALRAAKEVFSILENPL